MKKIIILGLVLLMVVVFATTVCGKAQKVYLVPSTPTYSGGEGFVIFNNSSGTDHNLELTVSLKGLGANEEYDIYLFVDGKWYNNALVGTVVTNKMGNANFHINVLLETGLRILALDVTLKDSLYDEYVTPGIYVDEGTNMTFE